MDLYGNNAMIDFEARRRSMELNRYIEKRHASATAAAEKGEQRGWQRNLEAWLSDRRLTLRQLRTPNPQS